MVAAARSPLCCAWEVSVLNESAGYQRGSECTEAARFSGEHLISSPASMGPSFSCRETEESLTWVDLLFLPQPPSALQAVRRGRGPVWEEAVVECSRCGFEGRKWLWKQQDTTRCEIQGHRKQKATMWKPLLLLVRFWRVARGFVWGHFLFYDLVSSVMLSLLLTSSLYQKNWAQYRKAKRPSQILNSSQIVPKIKQTREQSPSDL